MKLRGAIYKEYLEKLKAKLIAKYHELGLKASGEYEEELEYEVKGDKFTMWGAGHSYWMENGRREGRFPPVSVIENWIDVKSGLPQVFYENKKQMAFVIARKIAEEGIKVPNKYNKGEVVSAVINDFLSNDIYNLIEDIGGSWRAEYESDIIREFKKVA